MPQKYGDGFFGKVTFGGKKPEEKKQVPQQEFTPVEPDIAPPRVAEEIARRLHMALGSWGQPCILYQQQNEERIVKRNLKFDAGVIPFTATIWQRGNKKKANTDHPNIRKLTVVADGKQMTQVNNLDDLFGEFSFFAKEEQDKSKVSLIFSDNFNPNGKDIYVEYNTVCTCVDLNADQPSDPDCPLCFGLNSENSYKRFFNPIRKDGLIYIRKQHSPRSRTLEEFGYSTKNSPLFRAEPTPRLADKDIIEIVGGDFSGKRFYIVNHELHYLSLEVTSQTFTTQEITESDPIFKALNLLHS